MPDASPGVNFNTPISNKTTTNPYRETQIPIIPSLAWTRLAVIPSDARSRFALTMSIPSSQEMPYSLPQILLTRESYIDVFGYDQMGRIVVEIWQCTLVRHQDLGVPPEPSHRFAHVPNNGSNAPR
jgi:hypothetical protein